MGRRLLIVACTSLGGCAAILGLGDYRVIDEPAADAAERETSLGSEAGVVTDADPCVTLVSDDFKVPDPRWVAVGTATFENDEVVLTAASQYQRGAIFMAIPPELSPVMTTVTASYSIRFDASAATPADGVSLIWASDIAQPPLGGIGGSVGFCPDGKSDGGTPTGAALAVEVFGDGGISVLESNGKSCVYNPETEFPVTGTLNVKATVAGTRITATIGTTAFEHTTEEPTPIRWIGFGGGTGGFFAKFSVDDVVIRVCP